MQTFAFADWLNLLGPGIQEVIHKIVNHYGMTPKRFKSLPVSSIGPSWELWMTEHNLIRGWNIPSITPDHFYCYHPYDFNSYRVSCTNCTTLEVFLNAWNPHKDAYYFHHNYTFTAQCCSNLLGLYYSILPSLSSVCCVAESEGDRTHGNTSCHSILRIHNLNHPDSRCEVKYTVFSRNVGVELLKDTRSYGMFEFADLDMVDKLTMAIKGLVT